MQPTHVSSSISATMALFTSLSLKRIDGNPCCNTNSLGTGLNGCYRIAATAADKDSVGGKIEWTAVWHALQEKSRSCPSEHA